VDARRERRLLIGGKHAAGVVGEGLDRGGRGRLQNLGGIRHHEKKTPRSCAIRRRGRSQCEAGGYRRVGRKLSGEKS